VIFWCCLVPVGGAFISRQDWRRFRRRFDELRLRPFLDYKTYRRGEGGEYRFIGGFESVTDGHTLWIRNDELTVPIALSEAQTYVLPMPESGEHPESFDPGEEAPKRIRWDWVSALTEGAKVFAGGSLLSRDDRLTFVSTRENPLLVIFYDGPDTSLTARAIRAGRHKNEYWNGITPYALILGALSQMIIAANYLSRPAFRLTVITALIAIFTPLFPLIPPGILFTLLYRRLWQQARIFRAYRDLTRLPLQYLAPNSTEGRLPSGDRYGLRYYESPPAALRENQIPLLIPQTAAGRMRSCCVIGVLPEHEGSAGETGGNAPAESGSPALPQRPGDPFATFGVLPGKPETLARGFTVKAYLLEIIAWIALLGGIGLNIFFIAMIINLIVLRSG
jgi:hypothetical protein